MQYQIVLAPELGVSPEEFADAWNDDAQTSVVAEARVERPPATSYDPLTASTIVIDLLIGMAGSALYQLIHQALAGAVPQTRRQPQIEIEQVEQPDGTRLLVVHIKK